MEKKKQVKDKMSREEFFNTLSHGIGVLFSVIGLIVLIVTARQLGNTWHIVTFSVFGVTLILLYLASTLYHRCPEGKTKDLLKICDHSAIFLLIAGSYTPLTLLVLKGRTGWTLFAIVWIIAVAGIAFKVVFIKKFKILSTLLYIAMGWLVIFAIKPLYLSLSTESISFLVAGGLFYTVGTIFYSNKKIKYNHAIWHLFVLAGSICHFFTILFILRT